MARIKGKFCPLTDELGNDERFIINSTDLDKLMYILVIFTCHMTYHKAPADARFYKIRYGLRAKLGQIRGSIERLRGLYKGLSWEDGKVSLLNSATYKGELVQKRLEEEEVEVEEKKKKTAPATPTKSFFETLRANPSYKDLNIDKEYGKCSAWCLKHHIILTKQIFVNWLNRADQPLAAPGSNGQKKPPGLEEAELAKMKAEAAPMPEEFRQMLRTI